MFKTFEGKCGFGLGRASKNSGFSGLCNLLSEISCSYWCLGQVFLLVVYFPCQLSFHLCLTSTFISLPSTLHSLDPDSIAVSTTSNAAALSCFCSSSGPSYVSEFTQMWCRIPCKLSGSPGSRPPSFRPAAVFVDRCNQTLSWRITSHGLWPQAVLFNNVTPARPVAGFICRLSLFMRPCKYVETTTDRCN